jgi:Protein of unknown function (DUF3892)
VLAEGGEFKMSKYGIFKVRYEETKEGNRRISEVKAFLFINDDLINTFNETTFTRSEVAINLEYNLNEFVTIYNEQDKWELGSKVITEKIDDEIFIKTVPNGKKEDNLENLPEY